MLTAQCSGPCLAGYFCYLGSITASENECPDVSVYCPEGSPYPFRIPEGWTAANGSYSLTVNENGDASSILGISAITSCPGGSYCLGGIILPCPAGRYGATEGLQSAFCSEECPPGTYCPAGSIEPTSCPLGSYCPDGVTFIPCPAGTFGSSINLTDRICSGLCSPGYYCPPGASTSQSQPCPGGQYGSSFGLENDFCSGPCAAGYYCPSASINSTALFCGGADVYCPTGSAVPLPVSIGYYSINLSGEDDPGQELVRTAQEICGPGYYCEDGLRLACMGGTYGDAVGMNNSIQRAPYLCSGLCPAGYFCPEASAAPIPCAPGRYGATPGLSTEDCSGVCPLGHFCLLGSIAPIQCSAGLFGNCTGAADESCRGGEGCYSVSGVTFLPDLSTNFNLCEEVSDHCYTNLQSVI